MIDVHIIEPDGTRMVEKPKVPKALSGQKITWSHSGRIHQIFLWKTVSSPGCSVCGRTNTPHRHSWLFHSRCSCNFRIWTNAVGNLCYWKIDSILDTIIDLFPLLIDRWKILQSGETDSKPHKADNWGKLKLRRQKETGGFRFSWQAP